MIEDIKINVAVEQFFIYGENNEIISIKPNIPIYLFYNLKNYSTARSFKKLKEKIKLNDLDTIELIKLNDSCQPLKNLLDNYYNTFNFVSLEDLYNSNEDFIYPINTTTNDIFYEFNTITLDRKLVDCVHNKKAKICFFQLLEGHFGLSDNEFFWLYNLSKKYGFEKNDIIIVTANMDAENHHDKIIKDYNIDDNFTVFSYSYFQHNLWWLNNLSKLLNPDLDRFDGNDFLKNNRSNKKIYHFLCFNRIDREHRILMVGELLSNENLKDKSILSLGRAYHNNNKLSFFNIVSSSIKLDYKYNKQRLLDFYKNYDSTKHYIYDCPDLESNKASVLNQYAHKNTFVNIVTETMINNDTIFFSEKTFKPIYAHQPFIIFGNPKLLKKLKELGFKTFDNWWDESYDEEEDFTRRFEKIVDVLIEISSWSMEKCFQITNEMEEILIHNFNTMINNKETEKLYELLYSKSLQKQQKINKKNLI